MSPRASVKSEPMKAAARLYYTAENKALVPQGHPDAVTLAYGVGDEIKPEDEAKLPKPEKNGKGKA